MDDVGEEEYEEVHRLVAWCFSAAILLVSVAGYGWYVTDAISTTLLIISILIAIIFCLLAVSIITVIPSIFGTD